MALLLLAISAWLFYSTSKHFPLTTPEVLGERTTIRNMAGVVISVIAAVVLAQSMSVSTAIIVVLVSLMTLIPLFVFSLTLFPKSWKGWSVLLLAMALTEIVSYAG